MYTFYSSNILYIMFISCGEYARRYNALDRIIDPLLMWIGAWWMLGCVGLKMVYYKDKGEGEGKTHHMSTVNGF